MERPKPLVLIVDDDPMARMILGPALSQAGFDIEEAEDGQQALELFEARHPDLIILDVLMPGLDGFEVCSRIRSNLEGATVPILMLTGLDDLDSIRRAYEVGATDFAIKPMNWVVLAQRVRYMIRNKQLFDELCRTKARLKNAQRIAQLSNWDWHPDSGRFQCSEEVHGLAGVPSASLSTIEDFLALVHSDDREQVRNALQSCANSQRPCNFHHRIPKPDGSVAFIHGRAEVVREPGMRGTLLSGTIQDVTDRILAEERIKSLAYYDHLTGLANRTLLRDRLESALKSAKREGQFGAVLFIDLDRFKQINDTLGHSTGDKLLQAFAAELTHRIRISDTVARAGSSDEGGTVARLGGDEFIILLPHITKGSDAGRVARRILDSLQDPLLVNDQDVFTTASIGISLFPLDGEDSESLLKNADTAMYAAKANGRNTFKFYNASMNASAIHRLSLETSLRKAISRDEFVMYYQPLVDVQTRRIFGVEALIRWKRPEALVMPVEFIPLAEETGLIVPIGEWSVRTACEQGRLWHEAGHSRLRMSVNLRPRQFQDASQARLLETIVSSGFDTRCLEAEISERLLMNQSRETRKAMEDLRALQVRFSIDDFGTGYSSLSYLKRFPIDVLKIDRFFVRELGHNKGDEAITVAIINLARTLGIEAIAEGVETIEQRDFLLSEGCKMMQGFLFSHPVPAERIAELLALELVGQTLPAFVKQPA